MSASNPHEPLPPGRFWTAVGEWLDSVGATRPGSGLDARESGEADENIREWSAVEHVCPHCPICQGAAVFDRIDWQALSDLALAAANLMSGISRALLDPDAQPQSARDEDQT